MSDSNALQDISSVLMGEAHLGTVLVIEDDQRVGEGIAKVLRLNSYDVFLASGGAEGISKVLKFSPDLVICDIIMPGVDGFKVLQRIRSDENLKHTPFLFLSGRSDVNELREGMNQGADDYLTKPITPEALIKAVEVRFQKAHNLKKFNQMLSKNFSQKVLSRFPHELMTPLNAIIGFVELLKGEDLSETAGDLLNDIQSSAYRLERFFKKYMLFTELELIKEARIPERVGRALLTLEQLQQEGLKVATFFGRVGDLVFELESPTIPVCEVMFDRAIIEVIENAFAFSEEGTVVTVRLWRADGLVNISVENVGKGFSAKELDEVGMAFVRFERPGCAFSGMGIGLYIVKELMLRNSGLFEISSNEGKTLVRLALPACKHCG